MIEIFQGERLDIDKYKFAEELLKREWVKGVEARRLSERGFGIEDIRFLQHPKRRMGERKGILIRDMLKVPGAKTERPISLTNRDLRELGEFSYWGFSPEGVAEIRVKSENYRDLPDSFHIIILPEFLAFQNDVDAEPEKQELDLVLEEYEKQALSQTGDRPKIH